MRILLVLLIGIFTMNLSAQDNRDQGKDRKDRFEAQHVAFMTDQLELTPNEAEKFWPIYREFKEKEKDIREKYAPDSKPQREDLTAAAAAEQMIDRMFSMEQEVLNLKKEYYKKMMSAIPVEKVAIIPMIDRRFRGKVLDRAKSKRMKGMKGTKEKKGKR